MQQKNNLKSFSESDWFEIQKHLICAEEEICKQQLSQSVNSPSDQTLMNEIGDQYNPKNYIIEGEEVTKFTFEPSGFGIAFNLSDMSVNELSEQTKKDILKNGIIGHVHGVHVHEVIDTSHIKDMMSDDPMYFKHSWPDQGDAVDGHIFDYKDIPKVKLDPNDLSSQPSTYAQEAVSNFSNYVKKKKAGDVLYSSKNTKIEVVDYESLTKSDAPMDQQEIPEKNIQHKILHESLEDIVKYIRKHHFGVNKEIYALKLIRQFDGKKIPIEEMRGITLQNISVHDKRTLILTQKADLANTGNKISPYPFFESNLYLSELIMINVYDYSAEFISETNFDFTYSLQTKDAKTVMLAEWVHKKPKNLRAQWACDTDTEKLLESIGEGPKIHRQVSIPRGIDLE